jgi:hypothetical protein
MSVWGSFFSPLDAEDAVRSILQTWVDSALTEIERRTGEYAIRELPRPNSWRVATGLEDVEDWPDRDLPAVIVESAGEGVAPKLGSAGQVNGEIALNVITVYRGSGKLLNREHDRRIVVMLASAVRWVLLKHGDLGGIADGVILGATEYDIPAPTRPRTLSGAQTDLTVLVSNVANRYGLPDEPDAPAPTEPPPDSPSHPDHLSTHVSVRGIDDPAPAAPAGDRAGAHVSVVFSSDPAKLGASGAYRVRTATRVRRFALDCTSAPAGSPLTVQALRNGTMIAQLTIPAGSSDPQVAELSQFVDAGDLLSVNATSVGSVTPAGGVTAQLDLGA